MSSQLEMLLVVPDQVASLMPQGHDIASSIDITLGVRKIIAVIPHTMFDITAMKIMISLLGTQCIRVSVYPCIESDGSPTAKILTMKVHSIGPCVHEHVVFTRVFTQRANTCVNTVNTC